MEEQREGERRSGRRRADDEERDRLTQDELRQLRAIAGAARWVRGLVAIIVALGAFAALLDPLGDFFVRLGKFFGK